MWVCMFPGLVVDSQSLGPCEEINTETLAFLHVLCTICACSHVSSSFLFFSVYTKREYVLEARNYTIMRSSK